MKKLKTNVKEKPILATLLVAVIIGLVCLIIYVLNYYQPETELPPTLKLKTKSGEEIEFLLLSYDWTYKGKNKTYDARIEDITEYDFGGKNTILDTMESFLDVNDKTIETSPKYKAQGFIQNCLYYQDVEYSMIGSNQLIIEGGHKFNFVASSSGPNVITIELNSEKQGKAVYAIKYASTLLINADDIEEMKNFELDKEKINNVLKKLSFGQYLNNVELNNEEITLTYNYYIPEDSTNLLAQGIFTLVDEAKEINFDFAYNKYVKYEENQNVEFDKIDTVTYNRENFKSPIGMTIEEFKKYINR